jgi:hypothetical protein
LSLERYDCLNIAYDSRIDSLLDGFEVKKDISIPRVDYADLYCAMEHLSAFVPRHI